MMMKMDGGGGGVM